MIQSVYSHSCVCFFLFQSPPKGATIPYRPKPQVGGPVILAGGQAYTIQGNYAVPAHSDVSTVLPLPAPAAGPAPPSLNTQTLTTSPFAAHPSSFASHGHPLLSAAHLTAHHPLHPSPLHASVAGLADPLLKSGHLQAALPPAHLVADAVSLSFLPHPVRYPSSIYPGYPNYHIYMPSDNNVISLYLSTTPIIPELLYPPLVLSSIYDILTVPDEMLRFDYDLYLDY